MKNIHLIPTENPSRLIYNDANQLCYQSNKSYKNDRKWMHRKKFNICITNDEEIKEGDWCYYENGDLKGIHKVVNGQRPKTMILKKIILTTGNKDLIKDGVQAIDDSFLEWFVKNPSCESVEVKQVKTFNGFLDPEYGSPKYKFNYHIIIPQEEPKQESIEEAAKRIYPINILVDYDTNEDIRNIWIEGAKWQAERMCEIMNAYADDVMGGCNLRAKEWFEQVKK
jgi:hypothetical protein